MLPGSGAVYTLNTILYVNNIKSVIKMSRVKAQSNDFCWLQHKGKQSEIGNPESINKKKLRKKYIKKQILQTELKTHHHVGVSAV